MPIVQAGGSYRAPEPVREEKLLLRRKMPPTVSYMVGPGADRLIQKLTGPYSHHVVHIRHLRICGLVMSSCKLSEENVRTVTVHQRKLASTASSGHISSNQQCVTVPWKWKALDSLWKPWT